MKWKCDKTTQVTQLVFTSAKKIYCSSRKGAQTAGLYCFTGNSLKH